MTNVTIFYAIKNPGMELKIKRESIKLSESLSKRPNFYHIMIHYLILIRKSVVKFY